MRCEVLGCRRKQEYDSPGKWCGFHWARWWTAGMLERFNVSDRNLDEGARLLEAACKRADADGKRLDSDSYLKEYDAFLEKWYEHKP